METLLEKVIDYSTNSVGAFGNVKIGWLKTKPALKFAIKTMKKHDIIQSKHVDHIENEKNILEHLDHPFAVSYSHYASNTTLNSLIMMASFKIVALFTSPQNCSEVVIYSLTIEALATLT